MGFFFTDKKTLDIAYLLNFSRVLLFDLWMMATQTWFKMCADFLILIFLGRL
ncbi:hypothetical protein SR187_5710 [Streptococcus ruminantium]|uniref:Uncharacterized protein n=1 Tax=Streptococcus ruminantium TaxID=1917441 RepID=A0A2Z5TN85_9STRE|nr:hypothetical protein SR187_5710 [Streptococcus ruminantium]